MAIALAVGADNSRRRHHIIFIFAPTAAGPRMWPCIRFGASWKAVMDRFFAKYDGAVRIDINDAGATPGSVMLRLEQAVEVIEK